MSKLCDDNVGWVLHAVSSLSALDPFFKVTCEFDKNADRCAFVIWMQGDCTVAVLVGVVPVSFFLLLLIPKSI